MAKPCTAYLIDPFAQTIEVVTWNGDYKQIATLIDAQCFDSARIRAGDSIFVDDEGLFKDEQRFFLHDDYPHPLAGKGLVLGCDAEGESVTPACTVEELMDRVRFVLPIRINGGQIKWLDQLGQIVEIDA